MKKNFLISSGGSGGHIIPATILYDHLSEKYNVIISTDRRGLDYFDLNKYSHEIIDTPRLKNLFLFPFYFFVIFYLTIKSFILLKKKRIDKIFSIGGYMSIPLIFAARLLNLEIYLLEPNLVIGRANSFFLKFCKKIFCYSNEVKNFPQKFKDKKIIINPLIKKSLYNFKISPEKNEKFTILIVGGSQSASIFDKNFKNSIVNISKRNFIKIIQQTNQKNISLLREFYTNNNIENKIYYFDNNFESYISQSDLCISRGGATTLAELSFLNVPFLIVPLPTSKDNHQLENAKFYKNKNCCWILEQSFFEEKIENFINEILSDKTDFFNKKENLKRLNYQNTWNNVNQKILSEINED